MVGREGYKPEGVVIHVGEGSQDAIYETFLNEPKSSHYCVSKAGMIWQFVDEKDTAWAQGNVNNPVATLVTEIHPGVNPNMYLISIEHEGVGTTDFTETQYTTTAKLINDICTRWNIPIDRIHILRHNEIRANKTCPGIANVDNIVDMAKVGSMSGSIDVKVVSNVSSNIKTHMKFNLQAFGHAILSGLIVIVPLLLKIFPEWGDLTLSAVLLLIQHAYIQTT